MARAIAGLGQARLDAGVRFMRNFCVLQRNVNCVRLSTYTLLSTSCGRALPACAHLGDHTCFLPCAETSMSGDLHAGWACSSARMQAKQHGTHGAHCFFRGSARLAAFAL